jgi:hypothetical protein
MVHGVAEARVLDLKKRPVSMQLALGIGNFETGRTIVHPNNPEITVTGGGYYYAYEGYWGAVMNFYPLALAFGVEFLYTGRFGAQGSTGGAGKIYDTHSTYTGLIPKVTLLMTLAEAGSARFYAGLSYGYAYVYLGNAVRLTPAGTGAGYSEYTEIGRGQSMVYGGHVGYEFALSSNVTTVLEVGGRVGRVKEFSVDGGYKDIGGVDIPRGTLLLLEGGGKRELDLSAFFSRVGIRVYF